MSSESKSNPVPKSNVSTPDAAGKVATQFVEEELARSRVAAKRAKLTTLILLAVVGAYMSFITIYFTGFMEPKNVANVATSILSEKVDQHATEIADKIKHDVPEMVKDIPAKLIEGMPVWRNELELKLEEVMIDNMAKHSEDFGKNLDDFLALHQADIQELLNHTTDKDKMKVLMTALEQDILDYLDAETEDGESLKHKLDVSLEAIQNVEKQMNRLANAKDLNAQELKTRRAVALISRKVQTERAIEKPSKAE